jgi:hypothetical protein
MKLSRDHLIIALVLVVLYMLFMRPLVSGADQMSRPVENPWGGPINDKVLREEKPSPLKKFVSKIFRGRGRG